MATDRLEFFGPELSRGPFTSNSPAVAAVQMATALAQLRAPLTRADADIHAHADFIRALADRLMPDVAAAVRLDVNPEAGDQIATTIRSETGDHSLLHCWLADSAGGAETSLAPDSVSWSGGVVLQEITVRKRYLIVTPTTGIATPTVGYSGNRTWYWAVMRHGRVFYSAALDFN